MLDASFLQLNAEYGFAFAQAVRIPNCERFGRELDLIDHNYSQYLGLLQSWRMASPGFMEQFRRMLLSKLRVVFESAASELELWSRTASNQVDQQLGDRRRAFKQRRDSLQRIQSAAGELEQRIAEVETQDAQSRRAAAPARQARRPPGATCCGAPERAAWPTRRHPRSPHCSHALG
jgi:hypothetical protein